MKNKFALWISAGLGILFTSTALANKPKLIVQITIDQLRGDLLQRYESNFVESRNKLGFNRFLKNGTLYTNSHYRHASTLTAVGHATLATGALPSQHGLVANNWFDVEANSRMYCVADADTSLVGAEGYSASPANLTASTFSDQLYLASSGKAKVVSVSIKDRGAVLTGGHFGKSFWFDKKTGNMVTSTYYYDELPEWVSSFNSSGAKDQYLGQSWALSLNEDKYHNDSGNRLYQIPPKGFGKGFPHTMPKDASPRYYDLLTNTPFGDKLTMEFAKAAVTNEKLGDDDVTDYLAISFSVNDYVGHKFGPNSLEAEDNLLALDKTIAELFKFLDKKIGMENVLVALSADHGVDAIPEYKKSIGFNGFRGNASQELEEFNSTLSEKFGVEGKLIEEVIPPNLYLNHSLIKAKNLDYGDVAKAVQSFASKLNGVSRALTSEALSTTNLQFDPVLSRVQNNYMQGRSGDIVLLQNPSTMLGNYSAATHGSPYRYDTHVPLYFTGWRVTPRREARLTSPEDLAVTLSAVMSIGYPDKATGKVLEEIVK
ncbi:alkaline phosphatase family protein [Alteromonadaceae bacterium M269]|nr:alkaline phosphatase family protein [Alteromonadaceae bacterium M269]